MLTKARLILNILRGRPTMYRIHLTLWDTIEFDADTQNALVIENKFTFKQKGEIRGVYRTD